MIAGIALSLSLSLYGYLRISRTVICFVKTSCVRDTVLCILGLDMYVYRLRFLFRIFRLTGIEDINRAAYR